MFFDVLPVTGTTPGLVVDLSPYLAQLFLAVVTAVVAFVGNEARKFTKAHFNNTQLDVITKVATIGVQAAEQLYSTFNGEDKKNFAMQYAQAELAKRGINVDVEQLSAIIEAQVLDQFNYPDAVEPAGGESDTTVVQSNTSEPEVVVTTPVDGTPENEDAGDTV